MKRNTFFFQKYENRDEKTQKFIDRMFLCKNENKSLNTNQSKHEIFCQKDLRIASIVESIVI